MIEYEKKILLTENEYRCLEMCMFFHTPKTVQTNYYYDTDDLYFNKNGTTCRIREIDGVYTATVKKHGIGEDSASSEISVPAENKFDTRAFEGMVVSLKGVLTTERRETNNYRGAKVVIDRNTYLGTSDYELEVEYEEGHENDAMEAIEEVERCLRVFKVLPYEVHLKDRIGKSKSKSKRFFQNLFNPDTTCHL